MPHIVSLLFRSLTSRPEPAVNAAHVALRDILSLSAKNKDSDSPHRLPKNLLQMCIRPVLLNLRDYTKLSIPLLRGLSRLLSLLSSWFSKTLGEKLLEHLQRWTDPEKIISLSIWKRGEEPLVAAAIIELFELLPDDSSHFVEMLVKTTLKLENTLPRYKTCLIESPFRLPLAKYLNKHEEVTAEFFINDHRLKNPIYSDLLQDIIKRPESNALRKKLSNKQWSTAMLNVCFERSLAIIRAERGNSSTQHSLNSPRNAADILSMHGINIDLTGQGQKSAALRQVLEGMQEKLQSATKDETKVKERMEKLRRSEATAGPEKIEKIKKSMNNAQKQLDKAQHMLTVVRKELEVAQKEYSIELAKTNRDAEKSDARQNPRSMTFDALELQHQGFCLVETLIENDIQYISEHTDVVRAFRWLWRSKGRHFRLFHEDSMPPRFNGESRVLARFLVNFAKTSNDVDILFDLLRIFLQPTSSDFSFVQIFLKDTVCNSLTIDQKKRVMQRFFPVIASDGIEELKVLSIQLLILPMLKNDFESSLKSKPKKSDGIKTDSNLDDIQLSENEPISNSNAMELTSEQKEMNSSLGCSNILDSELTNTFIAEVLLQGGKSRTYGSRLSIELLKLSSLLLEFMGNKMTNHRQDLIKFTWSLLKSDDIKTKQWACISVCHYISVFPTPSKNVLQIYAILLRSHHQEAKDLACMAMNLLIPVLSQRLSPQDYAEVVQYTLKILYEEGNSLSTLSHIWRTVVRHEGMFYNYRNKIVPHLIVSLNKLGLPMNSSFESRKLAISMVELLLRWENCSSSRSIRNHSNPYKHDEIQRDTDIFIGFASPESSPTKKIKRLPKLQTDDMKSISSSSFIGKSELETVLNFLVRLTLLIAATDKAEQKSVAKDAHLLLQRILAKWEGVEIRIAYFDKVESMCLDERKDSVLLSKKDTTSRDEEQKNNKNDVGSNRSPDKAQASSRKVNNSKLISNTLLSACVEIFSNILQFAPQNQFLHISEKKICHILLTCFDHSREKSQIVLREKLKNFLSLLFRGQEVNNIIQETCKSYLESSLMNVLDLSSKKSEGIIEDVSQYDAALFFLQTVEDISSTRSNFPELLVEPLIVVAEKLSKIVMSTSSSKRNTTNSTTPSVSPFVAVFDEAYSTKIAKGSDGIIGRKKDKDKDIATKTLETSIEMNCLICCLRLIGKSSVPYYFTKKREKLINILYEILDLNSNIKLLLAVTVQIGTWLSMEKNTGPLTSKEKNNFVAKLTALEGHGLPEVESQPLFHAVSLIVLNVHQKDNMNVSKSIEDNDAYKEGSFLNRSLIGCLLVTNQRLRELVVNYFVSSLCGDIISGSTVVDYGLGKRFSIIKTKTAISDLRPIDILDKLFRSPFDNLGGRLWTFVFVDILLAVSNRSGGIKLSASNRDYYPISKSRKNEVGFDNKQQEKSAYTSASLANISQGDVRFEPVIEKYKKFLKVMSDERSDSSQSHGQCIRAVRTLASCDAELCQNLLEALMSKAWVSSFDNKERLSIIPWMEKLLTHPMHVKFLKKPTTMITSTYPLTRNTRHRDVNSIQMMLRAIRKMNPTPMFSIDAMLFLAKNYNCWHEIRT